jgi:hypothetical protein
MAAERKQIACSEKDRAYHEEFAKRPTAFSPRAIGKAKKPYAEICD